MAGIEEVAKLAGVSTATVSRALSGRGHVSPASKAKVEEAAARLGYVVSSNASSLASGRTRNIGVVIPFLNRWFFSSVLEGAQRELLRRGYDLTLYNLSGDGNERSSVFEHFLLRQRVDAVIAVSLELTEHEVTRLHDLGKPLVGVGGPIPGVPTLTIDDAAVGTARHRAPHRPRPHAHRPHRRRPRVRPRLPPAHEPPHRLRGCAARRGHRGGPSPVRARRLHDPGRVQRGEAAAGCTPSSPDGDLRGIR